MYEAIEIHL